MASFAESVAQNCQASLQSAAVKVAAIANDLFTQIVQRTRVDDGELIANWYPQVGSTFSPEVNPSLQDRSGYVSLARIASIVKVDPNTNLTAEVAFTLANNMPYAYRAEALGWPAPQWSGSKSDPVRMVALSILAVEAKYK